MSPERAPTPPHHPTYNVHLSTEVISKIAAITSPHKRLAGIEKLPSGKSFNNRIYFLHFEQAEQSPFDNGSDSDHQGEPTEQVLKLSGQFFGPDKIQNEVSCLLLLEQYCTSVPAPRVLAYSEDAVSIRLVFRGDGSGQTREIRTYSHPISTEDRPRGWILITRCPGRLLQERDLNAPYGDPLMRQLAGCVAQWRQNIPGWTLIGNFRLSEADKGEESRDVPMLWPGLPRLMLNGLLLCAYLPPYPISSRLEYYQIKMKDQLTKLETENVFAAKRDEVTPVARQFIDNVLPKLSLFRNTSDRATFTHYDFSPRNILVSDSSPPAISGIVDFEFAGMFPAEEEFAYKVINNDEDWPEHSYDVFLDELERLGEETPLRGIPQQAWRQAVLLMQLEGDLAPWYLREGGIQGDELVDQLTEAAARAQEAIIELKKTIG